MHAVVDCFCFPFNSPPSPPPPNSFEFARHFPNSITIIGDYKNWLYCPGGTIPQRRIYSMGRGRAEKRAAARVCVCVHNSPARTREVVYPQAYQWVRPCRTYPTALGARGDGSRGGMGRRATIPRQNDSYIDPAAAHPRGRTGKVPVKLL